MAYIELKDVTYAYPLTEKNALEHVSLSLERGKLYALLGANGSGKTTLCNVIRGFIPGFYGGELTGGVLLGGVPVADLSMGELALKMGYVFQNPFNQITGARDNVYEEIAYGLENFGVPVDEIRRRVDAVMKLTNTDFLADKNPFELSGGQQQRVALASILVLDVDIFVIDEPTSQLDPRETERVFDIIRRMKEMGKTIILAEHKIELIAEYADEVIALDGGRVVDFGEKHRVLSNMSLPGHGITLPQSVLLAERLRGSGVEIPRRCVTREELKQELLALKEKGGGSAWRS